MHNLAILLVGCLDHKSGFMTVRVEFLGLAINELSGIKTLQAVLLQRVHEDVLGHLKTLVKVLKVLVGLSLLGSKFVGGHDGEGTVKVVDRLEKVNSKFLDGK
jgi:hypothetical protein